MKRLVSLDVDVQVLDVVVLVLRVGGWWLVFGVLVKKVMSMYGMRIKRNAQGAGRCVMWCMACCMLQATRWCVVADDVNR
mmetsp:Transcript_6617/g.10557  ORF Transcript_6617/g.10557 Transcript_6617/m.10557 type:complete len:80 (-) Transcript_6617:486-725(-)